MDQSQLSCSTSNKSLLPELCRNKCTEVKYTIKHKSDQECDLYLKAVPLHKLGHSVSPEIALTELYYVKLSPCPMGFTLLLPDGLRQCDLILLSNIALITACGINDQIILHHPISWINGFIVNNSHNYYSSQQCPFDYCLPYASHVNLSVLTHSVSLTELVCYVDIVNMVSVLYLVDLSISTALMYIC